MGGGWLAGSNDTKANSAQFQVKLPIGAEIGNIQSLLFIDVKFFFSCGTNFVQYLQEESTIIMNDHIKYLADTYYTRLLYTCD